MSPTTVQRYFLENYRSQCPSLYKWNIDRHVQQRGRQHDMYTIYTGGNLPLHSMLGQEATSFYQEATSFYCFKLFHCRTQS